MIPTPNFNRIRPHPFEYRWKRSLITLNFEELDLLFTMLKGTYFMAEQAASDSDSLVSKYHLKEHQDKLKDLIETIDEQLE